MADTTPAKDKNLKIPEVAPAAEKKLTAKKEKPSKGNLTESVVALAGKKIAEAASATQSVIAGEQGTLKSFHEKLLSSKDVLKALKNLGSEAEKTAEAERKAEAELKELAEAAAAAKAEEIAFAKKMVELGLDPTHGSPTKKAAPAVGPFSGSFPGTAKDRQELTDYLANRPGVAELITPEPNTLSKPAVEKPKSDVKTASKDDDGVEAAV